MKFLFLEQVNCDTSRVMGGCRVGYRPVEIVMRYSEAAPSRLLGGHVLSV